MQPIFLIMTTTTTTMMTMTKHIATNKSQDLGIIFFPAFDWAISPTHPEREERLLYTQDQLREEGLFDVPGIQEFRADLALSEDIERTHFCLPGVEKVCTASHMASAGGAICAAKLVLDGDNPACKKAFALVRPPGHHAMRITYGNRGFCNVNMEAIMLDYIRQNYGKKLCGEGEVLRIAVVDTDCHHGDGSQDIFWNDPHTLFISLHQDGRTLYPGSGFVEECGGIGALGKTINIPLPPHTGDIGYLYAMQHAVLPILADFKPHLIINSAGQDNHFTDPLANMRLTAQGYARLTELLQPHIAVLEGGYSIREALPYVNLAICLALAGKDFSDIYEPDWNKSYLAQDAKISDYIKKLSDEVLKMYHTPPAQPFEGQREKNAHGAYWVRDRNIYYDTDRLHDRQHEQTYICQDCAGLTSIISKATHMDKNLCLLLPRNPCEKCTHIAEELAHNAQKSREYAHIRTLNCV